MPGSGGSVSDAPIEKTENDHCIWQKERKKRTDLTDRETLRKSINKNSNTILPNFA